MHRRERLVVFALLACSLLLHVVPADGARVAVARAAAWIQDLGPAERVTLVATAVEGEEAPAGDMVVANRGERLSWGEHATARAYAIAIVDDAKVITALMESEQLQEQRDVLLQQLNDERGRYEERLRAIAERANALDPEDERNSAALQQAFQEYRAVEAEFQQWQQQAQQRGDELEAGFLEEAYRQLVAAADVVADRHGVDLVLRAVPADTPFEVRNPRSMSTNMRMRTALIAPDGVDLTDDVLEELDLPLG